MSNYESVFVLNPELSEEETKGLVEKFKLLVENAGKVENVEEWGKRKLAYDINGQKEGYYVVMSFSLDPQYVKELERNYKITDGVIRYLIVKKDK